MRLAIRPLNILVGCECSGRVRDELRDLGHNAWSCDLFGPESTDSGLSPEAWAATWRAQRWPAYHLEGDVRLWLPKGNVPGWPPEARWDVLIAHPPCTRLTNAGVRWLFKGGKGDVIDPDAWRAMVDAAKFYVDLWAARDIAVVVLENPIMHKYARNAIADLLKWRALGPLPPRQYVQPYMFGDPYTKRTGFHVRGADPIEIPPRAMWCRERKPKVHHMSPGPDRWYWRSLTEPGIARALAQHFGGKIRGRSAT